MLPPTVEKHCQPHPAENLACGLGMRSQLLSVQVGSERGYHHLILALHVQRQKKSSVCHGYNSPVILITSSKLYATHTQSQ